VKDLYAWSAIGLIVLASTTGDVLLSYSMKRVGDVGELWKQRGALAVVARVLAMPTFAIGLMAMGIAFYSLLFGLSWGISVSSYPFRLVDLCGQCSRRTHISTRTRWAPPVDCGFAGGGRVVLMAV